MGNKRCIGCVFRHAPQHIKKDECATCDGPQAPKSTAAITPATAEKLAHECGGRRYGAVTRVDDYMLYMGKIPMSAFADNVAHSLAHEIMKNMPANLMVERKGGGSSHPPFGISGVTEFRTDVVVFSLDSFDRFVECLLKAYGNRYADAAMHTKKKALADQVQQLVHKASEAVKQASFEAGAIVEKA